VVARIFLERRDLDDDLRGLFNRLDDNAEGAGVPGECSVPLDVVETAQGIEIMADVAGVAADAIKILFVGNTLVIVGRKLPSACEHREAAFHLAERTFGHFARGVRLAGAFDAGRADARLQAGELRVTLPRIEERRGGEIRIRVRAD
jgi:HSP20 family protein